MTKEMQTEGQKYESGGVCLQSQPLAEEGLQ